MDSNTIKSVADAAGAAFGHQKNFWEYLSDYGGYGLLLLFWYMTQRQYLNHINSLQTHYEKLMGTVLEISTNFVKGQEAQESLMDKNLELLTFLKNRIK
jgi:hypothetical protein